MIGSVDPAKEDAKGDSETTFAIRVGCAVIADAEGDTRRYADLAALIDACTGQGRDVEEPTEREYRLGLSALAAQRVCADPAALDRLPDDERAEELLGFSHFLVYLGGRRVPHLAPGPPTVFPEVLRRYTDGEKLALAWRGVAMVMIESVGFDGYAPIDEEIERHVAALPEPIASAVKDTERRITRNPAIGVGRALRAEVETGARRFRSLDELLRASAEVDIPAADDEQDDYDHALGSAAMTAASLCAEPDLLDRMPEARPMLLASFAITVRFVLGNKLWHLAPEPFDHYPVLIERYDDPVDKAEICLRAASIVRESGDVELSLNMLLALDGSPLSPRLAAALHLHAGDTFRDVRRFEEAARRYDLADEAARATEEPHRSTLLAEIAHMRHRLSLYLDDPDHQADPDDRSFDPNPFRPGSILRDPERWRAAPARLLTLAQEARTAGDARTAYHALRELAAAVLPSDYELLTSLHHEAAELAHQFGRFRDTVRWHGFLGTCAAILCGSRRELGLTVSRQAARLAAYTDSLPAYTLARWAAAADRVSLYSASVKANIGFVLYRNGSLSVSKARFDASLAEKEDVTVRVQRDLVAALLGEPADTPADDVRKTKTGEMDVARWRAAARLLTGPADDVHTWESLLRFSKGELTQWSELLHHVVQAHRPLLDDALPTAFGNTAIDNAKSRVFEAVYTSGLLGMLDRLWSVPPWASAAWVLAGRTTTAIRERIGLEVVASSPAPGVSAVFAPDPPPIDPSEVPARIDRLLALTFLPAGNTDFGDAEDAAGLRAWAVRFLAEHAGRIAFRVVDEDESDRMIGAEWERRTLLFQREVARLPPHLRLALGFIEMRMRMAVASGPVRDIKALEREYVAELDARDARQLQALLDSRTRITTDLLPSAAERHRAEVRGWFTGHRQGAVDLVQGTRLAHLITCRPNTTDVADVEIGRPQAQSAVERARLPSTAPDVVRLADALRTAIGADTEVSLRLCEPWAGIPVENVPDTTGHVLSDDVVVVRRHRGRPRFGAATTRLPRRVVRVLGDPRGSTPKLGLPGSFEEAHGVAEVFEVEPRVRDDATWDALRECAAQAELLWISTHCEPFADLGGTPALLLRDRWVLPTEIAALDLRPGSVVVLTVCAGGRGVSLGAVSGLPLATAFLDAGAALVVSPLRPIRDIDWAPLIVEAAQRTRAHLGAAVGLVRMLNASAPGRENGGPWVMHA
jgi:CHAT domain